MITLHVEAETVNELMLKVTDALYGHTPEDAEHVYSLLTNPAAPTIEPQKAPQDAPKPAVEDTPAPKAEAPTAAQTAPEERPLQEQVRALGLEIAQTAAGKAALRTILNEIGVKKVTDLTEEQMPLALEKMKAVKEAA